MLRVSSLFFRAPDTTEWGLVDKAQAVNHLSDLREGISKPSETASLSMETATVVGNRSGHPKNPSDSNSQKQSSRKRKYKRSVEKYQSVVNTLDQLCDEYKKVLKNPFANLPDQQSPNMTAEAHAEKVIRSLGSTEKIMGILQCYNYFSPIIQIGLKKMNDKEDTALIKKNMAEMSQKMLEFVDFAKGIQDEKDKLKFEKNCANALGKRKRKSSGVQDEVEGLRPGGDTTGAAVSALANNMGFTPFQEDRRANKPFGESSNPMMRAVGAFQRHEPEENPILKKLRNDGSIRVGEARVDLLLRTFEETHKMVHGSDVVEYSADEEIEDSTNRKHRGSVDIDSNSKAIAVNILPFSKLRVQEGSNGKTGHQLPDHHHLKDAIASPAEQAHHSNLENTVGGQQNQSKPAEPSDPNVPSAMLSPSGSKGTT